MKDIVVTETLSQDYASDISRVVDNLLVSNHLCLSTQISRYREQHHYNVMSKEREILQGFQVYHWSVKIPVDIVKQSVNRLSAVDANWHHPRGND